MNLSIVQIYEKSLFRQASSFQSALTSHVLLNQEKMSVSDNESDLQFPNATYLSYNWLWNL